MDIGRFEHEVRPNEQGGDGGNAGLSAHEEETRRLLRLLAGTGAAEGLYRTLTLASAAGTIATPTKHVRLLESIVETAAQVISARAAALFLLDRETGELVFEVALGGKAEEVKKFRVPMGHGIAGLVAATGQPIALADAEQDARRADDIASAVDYVPHTILCVPLFYDGEVIGVLELLDKEGGASFTGADIELLGLFANQASSAIELSRVNTDLDALVAHVIQASGGPLEEASAISDAIKSTPALRQALELATMIQQIASYGEGGLGLCRTVLSGLLAYLTERPEAQAGLL
ncbi:MAG: GAF domain-containing protein [Chloroflexia bacterium]